MNNPLGQRIYDDIINGFLNATSVWLVPKVLSSEPKDMLPGQQGQTVTKWRCLECSLCDTPANANAIIVSDENGNKLNLSSLNARNLNTIENAELQQLIKLSGAELWMQGKLERLKKLSFPDFQYKHIEAFGTAYKDKNNALTGNISNIQLAEQSQNIELQNLRTLNGKELWMQGKLERLKEISDSDFKLKYKEAFGVEYKA